MLINKRIENILKQYIGGREFFDALDDDIRKNIIYSIELLGLIKQDKEKTVIVVSGQYGKMFKKKFSFMFKHIICLPGGLRKLNSYTLSSIHKDKVKEYEDENYNFIFIDDSYYSGTTVQKASQAMNIEFDNIYVIYDGSIDSNSKVISLYRYYDKHKRKEMA